MILNLMYGGVMNFFSVIMMIIFLLVGVAFLTLLERKVLSYMQYRKGPNKVGYGGILQPFSDAIKLFCKEGLIIMKSNYYFYYLSPVTLMFIMIMTWMMLPWITNIYYMNYSMLLMFVLMSMSGYMLLFIGWSSNSSYSLIGAIRFISQSISYEVSFILLMFGIMMLGESFSLCNLMLWQFYVWNLILLFPLFLAFFVSVLAELNRSPLDLIEGESELVSGFNIEYFGGGFALIFLGEYGSIIFFCFIIMVLFSNLYKSLSVSLILVMGVMLMIFMVIYMRGVMPRIRYDELMYLCWKIILPLILNYLLLIFGVKIYLVVS